MHAQQLQELSQIIGDIAKSQAEASQSGPNIWQQLLDVLPNLRNPQRVMEIIQQHAMNPHGEQAFIDSPALHDDLSSLIDDQSREEFESKEQDDLSAVLMTDQVPGRKRRKGSPPDRHSVTQEWNESEAKTEKPNIEADLGAIGDAITNPQTGPALTEKPKAKPKKQYPKIYHRRDSDGNTMAELLEMRDAARGKANKDAARAKIQKWTAEFDAQSRGAGDFADNTAEQWHEEKRERERNAETVEPTLADDLDAIKAATPNRKQAKDAERAKTHPDEFKPTPPPQQSKPAVPSVPEARTETPTAPDVDLENDPNGTMTSTSVSPVSQPTQPAAPTPQASQPSQPESSPSRRRRKPKLGPRTEIDDLTDEHAKFHGWAEDEAENRIAQEFPQKMGFLDRFRASRNAILAKILSQNPNRQMPTVDVAPASYTFDRDESSDFLATKQPLVEKYRSENPNATDQDVAGYAAGIVTDDEQGLPAHIRQLIATAKKEKQQAFYEYLTPEGDVEMSVPVDENLTDSMGRQNSFLHIPSGLAQVSFRPQAEPEFAPQAIDSDYVAQSLRDDLGGVVDAKRQRGMDDADIDRSMRPLVHSYLHDEAGMPQRVAQQIAAAQQQGYVANYEVYNDRNKVLSSARVNHTLQDESGESIIDPQAIMAGRSRIRFTPATFAGERSQEQEQTATERQDNRQSLVSRWRAKWNQRKQQIAEKRREAALQQKQQRAEKTQYAHEQRQQQASQVQQQRHQQSMPVESPTLQDDLETIQQAQDHTFNRRPPAQEQTSTPVPGQASQPVAQPAATRRQRQSVPQAAPEPQQHESGQPANYDVDDPQNVDDPEVEEQEAGQSGKPSFISRAVDAGQNVLDAIGVVDPTPISDGINAGISLFRGMVTDRGRRKQHMKNAAISTASMVPYIGDTSKIFKAKSMMKAGDAAATSNRATTAARRADVRDRTNAVAGYGFSQSGSGANSPNDPPMPDPTTTAQIQPIGDTREEREGEQKLDGFMDKLKAAGDKLLDFLGPVGKAAGAAFAFLNGLSLLNTGVLAVNRSLEQYNGEIANAYARADMDQVHRDINKGNAMAGPLSDLAEQQSELKDTFAQVTVPMQVLMTRMLAVVTKGVNYAANATGIPDLISKIATIVGLMPGQDVGITGDWSNFLQDVSDGKFDGKRPVFDQNGRKFRVENILNDQDTKDIFG